MTAITFVLQSAISLDGFIAAPDGSVDFLKPYPASVFGFDAFYDAVDLCVMGRHTYEQSRAIGENWGGDGKPAIILASTPVENLPDGVEVWRGNIKGLAHHLAADALGDRTVWIVGGARTNRGFLDAGHIDRIELTVVPVALGSGLPLFDAGTPAPPRSFTLASCTQMARGVVRLIYERA